MQKCLRGYQVCSYFKELKKATILVQSWLKGKRVRKEYGVLKHRNKEVVTIQKDVKFMIGRQQYLTALTSTIVIQACKIEIYPSTKIFSFFKEMDFMDFVQGGVYNCII